MKKPSFQFYPGDWRKDQNLSRASLSAKGALIEILCLAFECEKRGKLITDKKPWTKEEIAYAIGGDQKENILAIEELLSKKILKKDSKNVIYSARMVRDEKLRKIRQEAGLKGGNPNLVNQKVKQKTTPSTSSSTSSSNNTKEYVWIEQLQADQYFLEQASQAWSIDAKTFRQMISDFLSINGKNHKDYSDLKTHFFNWGQKKFTKYREAAINHINPKMLNAS